MSKQEFYYQSADGATQIHATKWLPDGKPRAVLQLIHGMTEYMGRYGDFAEYMNKKGFVVVGAEHLGHGLSVQSEKHYGYFGEKGNEWLIQDIHQLRLMTQEEYPDLPYMMLGHSMGSFLIRQYITEQDASYAEGLSGVIVMGTGWQPEIALTMGKLVSKMYGLNKLEKKAPLVEALSFATYLKRIENPKTVSDWLTRDRKIVTHYRMDPLCTFHFTPNGFYNMFVSISKAQDLNRIKKLPAGLPILFISGAEDPVGAWGEAVRKAYMIYSENTDCDVSIKLFLDDRHELLHELDKEDVHAYIGEFCDSCLNN